MNTEESLAYRRGNPTRLENSAAGKNGGAKKLDANLLDALWAEVMALNRAAGPWAISVPEMFE